MVCLFTVMQTSCLEQTLSRSLVYGQLTCSTVKNLDVKLDSKLSFENHMPQNVTKTAFFHLRKLPIYGTRYLFLMQKSNCVHS